MKIFTIGMKEVVMKSVRVRADSASEAIERVDNEEGEVVEVETLDTLPRDEWAVIDEEEN